MMGYEEVWAPAVRRPEGKGVWMPYRLIKTSSGEYMINEHFLKYVEVKRNIAALIRAPPGTWEQEPNLEMRVLEGSQINDEQLQSLLESVLEEEIEVLRGMPKTRPVIELIKIFRKKLDESEYIRRERRRNEAKWVIWILEKRMRVKDGIKCLRRVYIPMDLLEDSLIDLNKGTEDKALTLLARSDIGIRKRVNDILVGL